MEEHEIPVGWGLLVRDGTRLQLRARPEWRDVDDPTRLTFLHRLSAANRRAANREAGVDYHAIECERRGMPPPTKARPFEVL